MNAAELDLVYSRLCETMSMLGADQATLFLARFAMLAIDQAEDPASALRLIEEAAAGIRP